LLEAILPALLEKELEVYYAYAIEEAWTGGAVLDA
jgi:hypothetical protein